MRYYLLWTDVHLDDNPENEYRWGNDFTYN